MGPAFTRVLLNGAPVASGLGRQLGGQHQCQPRSRHGLPASELFSSASVYKSQKASIIEGGLAGDGVDVAAPLSTSADLRSAAVTFSGNHWRPRQALGQDKGLGPDQQHLGPACGGVGGRWWVAFGQTFYRMPTT